MRQALEAAQADMARLLRIHRIDSIDRIDRVDKEAEVRVADLQAIEIIEMALHDRLAAHKALEIMEIDHRGEMPAMLAAHLHQGLAIAAEEEGKDLAKGLQRGREAARLVLGILPDDQMIEEATGLQVTAQEAGSASDQTIDRVAMMAVVLAVQKPKSLSQRHSRAFWLEKKSKASKSLIRQSL